MDMVKNLGVLAEIGYAPRSRQCLTVKRGHSGANPGAPTKIILEFDGSARTLLIVGNVTFDSDLKDQS
jgi:hypothetical protein